MKTKKPKFKECDIVQIVETGEFFDQFSELDNIQKDDYLMIDNVMFCGDSCLYEFVWEDRFHLKNLKVSFSYNEDQLKLVKRLIK